VVFEQVFEHDAPNSLSAAANAAKEFAITQINELTERANLSGIEVEKLQSAVNLLDAASSAFAAHEQLKSSRQRLVNEVRRLYQLQS